MSQETLRNPTNFAENLRRFHADFVKLPCSYSQKCSTTSAESVFHVRGMILRCPRICPYPVNIFVLRGASLLYTNMKLKLRTGSYVRTLNTMQSPSSAGDSKTMVGTYTAFMRTLHYCSNDWGTNVLPTCPPPGLELVLSPASIAMKTTDVNFRCTLANTCCTLLTVACLYVFSMS